ncbi:unnamed protein product [Soboliphyme baturini]|uniref:Protein UBASH3A-like protein n=1 Tax=Soboliphyme baturini TaxID=241478 RepID=A0A183IQ17_9BILA|nr:unnamed protein product [Soboliphyme baturini]
MSKQKVEPDDMITAVSYRTEFSVIDMDALKKVPLPPSKTGPVSAEEETEEVASLQKASKIVMEQTSKAAGSGRKIFIIRDGERLDQVFPGWERRAFTTFWEFKPYDLNIPMKLLTRTNGPMEFRYDPPLTEIGYAMAQLIGRGAKLSNVKVDYIYSSPAMSCLQTAHGFLKSFPKSKLKIRVEPGLFDFMAWYRATNMGWLTVQQLVNNSYEVDESYVPIMTSDEVFDKASNESIVEYYQRSAKVINKIIKQHSEKPVAIALFAHATSLDAISHELMQRRLLPTMDQMIKTPEYYPYNAAMALEQRADGAKWQLMPSALPPISYDDFTNRFNFRFATRGLLGDEGSSTDQSTG